MFLTNRSGLLYYNYIINFNYLIMTTISIELPESIFHTLGKSPDELAREMKIAAAVKWYELGSISQGKAAEIAGLNRIEFMDVLIRYQVSPFQYTAVELAEEIFCFSRKDAKEGKRILKFTQIMKVVLLFLVSNCLLLSVLQYLLKL